MDAEKHVKPGQLVPRNEWRKPVWQMTFGEAVQILSCSFSPRDRLPVLEDLFPDVVHMDAPPMPPPPENRRRNLIWHEYNTDNSRTFNLLAFDGLSQRYVEAVARATEQGKEVPAHILQMAKNTEYFANRTKEALERQKREIAAMLGDPEMDPDLIGQHLPKIISFLKLAAASSDPKVAKEAQQILNAIKNKNDMEHRLTALQKHEQTSTPKPGM